MRQGAPAEGRGQEPGRYCRQSSHVWRTALLMMAESYYSFKLYRFHFLTPRLILRYWEIHQFIFL